MIVFQKSNAHLSHEFYFSLPECRASKKLPLSRQYSIFWLDVICLLAILPPSASVQTCKPMCFAFTWPSYFVQFLVLIIKKYISQGVLHLFEVLGLLSYFLYIYLFKTNTMTLKTTYNLFTHSFDLDFVRNKKNVFNSFTRLLIHN